MNDQDFREFSQHEIPQPKPTREQLEHVSNLLQACKLCGATFKSGLTSEITMPDGVVHGLREREDAWLVFRSVSPTLTHEQVIPKTYSAEQIHFYLLQHHMLILELSAGLRPSYG